MRLFVFCIVTMFFLNACSNHANINSTYEKAFINKQCDENTLALNNTQKDTIYTGLNLASLARICKDYEKSNAFFDKAEEAYKIDVDLQNNAQKTIKNFSEILLNDTINDYQGYFYERIMLNTYKGLNYMSLGDFKNARVEFNRALYRQDRMKEEFYSYIQKAQDTYKKELQKDKNLYTSFYQNLNPIYKQYDNLLSSFNASKNFTNIYATYVSALFFFFDKDYIKAYELLKEVALADVKNTQLQKQFQLFENFTHIKTNFPKQKYIFIIYENGFSATKKEFNLTLPFIFNDNIANISVAFAYLKARNASYKFLQTQDEKTQDLIYFDDIIASEFKTLLPSMVMKTLASSALKTSINLAIANNDSSGILSFISTISTTLINKADLRMWQALPKSASILMVKNEGLTQIYDDKHKIIFEDELEKDKNYILLIRSFVPNSNIIYKIKEQ
ncbi:hypothetical protein IMC75_03840 [Campylobacter peloridis]|uniref:Lipoprotein n=1 Tax=Campylobacter peloridis TaxID=488546 RepID=A0ABX6TUB0_9BACT|nr:hypothetical protein [Campylobacter peloridis]AJC84009.1 hypothetical protein CPEL_0136 [Campylobacter peloridis LMG 23910]QOQ89600.1 hypothetical protein IMC75_03840 [Campylobacter peloridis]